MSSVSPTAVGGFVLGGLAVVVAAILFFGGGEVFAPKTKAVAFFEGSVGGLARGAAVTYRGVRVGSVSSVSVLVDPTELKARIPVYLRLEPDRVTLVSGSTRQPMLPRLIEAGLRAKLVSESLVTGQMLVELDLAPETPGHVVGGGDPDVPEIPTIQSDLQELREQLTHAPIAETVAQAQRTLAAIEKVAVHLDGEIDSLAASAQRALDSVDRTMDVASTSIKHLDQSASSTLTEAQALAADGRQQLASRGAELSRALVSADKTLQAIDGLVLAASSLIAPRSQPRSDLEAMLRDLAATASQLRDFSHTIERDPSVVLRGKALP